MQNCLMASLKRFHGLDTSIKLPWVQVSAYVYSGNVLFIKHWPSTLIFGCQIHIFPTLLCVLIVGISKCSGLKPGKYEILLGGPISFLPLSNQVWVSFPNLQRQFIFPFLLDCKIGLYLFKWVLLPRIVSRISWAMAMVSAFLCSFPQIE